MSAAFSDSDSTVVAAVGIPVEVYCKDLSEKLWNAGRDMDREGHYVSADKIRAVLEDRPSVPRHAPLCCCHCRYDAIPCPKDTKRSTTPCFSCGEFIAVDKLPNAKIYPALACKIVNEGLVVPCNANEGKTVTICEHCDNCPDCIQAKECSVCKRVGLLALSGNGYPASPDCNWFSCQDQKIYMKRSTVIVICLQCAHDKSLEQLKADLLNLTRPDMERALEDRAKNLAFAVERKKELDAMSLDTQDEKSIGTLSDVVRRFHHVLKGIQYLGDISAGPNGLRPRVVNPEDELVLKRQREDEMAFGPDYLNKRKKDE